MAIYWAFSNNYKCCYFNQERLILAMATVQLQENLFFTQDLCVEWSQLWQWQLTWWVARSAGGRWGLLLAHWTLNIFLIYTFSPFVVNRAHVGIIFCIIISGVVSPGTRSSHRDDCGVVANWSNKVLTRTGQTVTNSTFNGGQGDGGWTSWGTRDNVHHLLLVLDATDVLLAGVHSGVGHPVPELVLVGLVNTCATSTHPSTCIICFNIIVFNVIVVIIVIIAKWYD